ncbi:MAG TPA: DUF5916 domain-containing protein [Bacteroidales bacterium]|nr:DUF5916 domain-containing protein [Bacteroidales bacterium]
MQFNIATKLKYFTLIFSFLFFAGHSVSFARGQRNSLHAVRVLEPPTIDGVVDDEAWQLSQPAAGFNQYEPHNDRAASHETFVWILYDDNFLYIGARMVDPEPENILTELSLRDRGGHLNSDQFWIDINPFDDGIYGFQFRVSASGVQTDRTLSHGGGGGGGRGGGGGDINWDAVWMSATSINDSGWEAEIRIPYSALRFPVNGIEGWGINFWREIRRYRETSSWNFVDRQIGDAVASMGLLTGIHGIRPPLRLAFFPYTSAYQENDGTGNGWHGTMNGGLDVKFGIDESFTLDMTLIPDFGQVQSDAMVLNLSPFEIRHPERRPFFTEGTELFTKADLFYSRRVGARPSGFNNARNNAAINEMVLENPLETRLINASKLSGRTEGGLGIGVFNAMTAPSHATILDTITGLERQFMTQAFTNYSLVVLDQSLPNNSYISLVNTNVAGRIAGYNANVTGTDFRFLDRTGMFRIAGNAALSQQYFKDREDNLGYKYNLIIGKFGGRWQYNYGRSVINNTYNQNDMGFMLRNNFANDRAALSYHIFQPFWRLLSFSSGISASYERLHEGGEFAGFDLEHYISALFSSRLHIMTRIEYSPFGERDHFEPRVPGRFFDTGDEINLFARFSTDHRRRLYWSGDVSYEHIYSDYNQHSISFELGPHFRVNDRMNINYNIEVSNNFNDIGYVSRIDDNNIFFGMRNITTTENTLDANYILRHNLSLGFVLRHYWSMVDYTDRYFFLLPDGSLRDEPGLQPEDDINFNAFTLDVRLTWNFAPGSQMTAVWKNSIESEHETLIRGYFDNFQDFINRPQMNSFSIKFLYYLDFQNLRTFARSR